MFGFAFGITVSRGPSSFAGEQTAADQCFERQIGAADGRGSAAQQHRGDGWVNRIPRQQVKERKNHNGREKGRAVIAMPPSGSLTA